VLTHARELNPLNTDHTANLARLYRRWSDLESTPQAKHDRLIAASDYYSQATVLSPQNAQLWNEWATVNLSLHDVDQQLANDQAANDLQKAQSLLDHSLTLDQQYDQTYLIRGQLDRFLGKNDEAITEYQNALKWNPDSADAWGGMTDLYSSTGNYTAVETVTVAFLQTHPNFLPGMRTLVRNVYAPRGRLQEAIDMQQQIVSIASDPSNPDANLWDDYRVLSIVLAQAGRLPEALQAAQNSLSKAPQANQAEVQTLISQIQAQLSADNVLSNTNVLPGPTPTPSPTPAP
jgi:tetratricopeptide (TPR) repeat protein